jgi:hypothetical protein
MNAIENRKVWEVLVAYANGPIDEGLLGRLQNTILSLVPVPARLNDGFNFGGLLLDGFSRKAHEGQERFQAFLTSLCDGSFGTDVPGPLEEEARSESPKLLFQLVKEELETVQFTLESVTDPDPKGFGPYIGADQYFDRQTGRLKKSPLGRAALSVKGSAWSFLGVLFRFVIEECERARAEEKPLPIFVCLQCKKLVHPKRRKLGKGRNQFCSGTTCKDDFYNQNIPREQRSAEQFLNRWAVKTPGTIRNAFVKPGFEARYQKYKAVAPARSQKHIQRIEHVLRPNALLSATTSERIIEIEGEK